MQPLEGKLKFYLPFNAPIQYGFRHGDPTYYNAAHRGDDFILPKGTPIYAPADSLVVYANEDKNFGKQMLLQHPSIEGHTIQSYMTHFLDFAIHVGQTIKRGGLLGTIDKTGLWSGNTDHLHWSVKINSVHYSPVPYLVTNIFMKYERIKDKFIQKFTDQNAPNTIPYTTIVDGKTQRNIIRKTESGEIIEKNNVPEREWIAAFSVWD